MRHSKLETVLFIEKDTYQTIISERKRWWASEGDEAKTNETWRRDVGNRKCSFIMTRCEIKHKFTHHLKS
jgi:hypothetical protein